MKKIGILLLMYMLACLLGCATSNDNTKYVKSEPKKIKVVEESVPNTFSLGNVDLTCITLKVYNVDGAVWKIPLKNEYIDDKDLEKLTIPGVHFLTVIYGGVKTKFALTIEGPAESDECYIGNVRYLKNSDKTGYRVYGYKGSPVNVVIKDTCNGLPVVEIASSAFADCKTIEGIKICNNVTTIGGEAFKNCTNLKTIIMGDKVKNIGYSAFANCEKLETLKNLDSIESVGKNAFYGCRKLQYTVYDNAKYFGDGENKHLILVSAVNEDIEECDINENCKIIMSNAFFNCKKMKSINVPENVITICDGAFRNCESLREIMISEGIINIGWQPFEGCISLENISIPSTVENVNNQLFSELENINYNLYHNGCYIGNSDNPYLILVEAKDVNIEECEISNDCRFVQEEAFMGCTELKYIEIPGSITAISEYMFKTCISLENVLIGEGVEEIAYRAFSLCRSLKSMTLPSTLKHISDNVFDECENLENIYYNGNIEEWCGITFLNLKSNPMYYAEHFYQPFDGKWKELEILEVPGTVKNLGKYQFYGFENITELIICDGVLNIDTSAFSRCINLQSVEVPESLTGLGEEAFNTCESLQRIDLFSRISCIGDSAFFGCKMLREVKLPPRLTEISMWAFDGCESLKELVLPETVLYIDNYAFARCDNLVFNIEKNLKYLGSKNNPFFALVETVNDDSDEYFIDSDTVIIADSAFFGCKKMTNIEIPDKVKAIGTDAFNNCGKMESVKIGEGVMNIGNRAFYACTELKDVVIPSSVKEIGEEAFAHCIQLKNVVIKEGVKKICQKAFSCSRLESVVLPKGVVYIERWAFNGGSDWVIYCGETKKPINWDEEWHSDYCTVKWGYNN